ncbi:MAG: hypothetical protein NC210_08605 [[Clostridium] fimetarium]|nr:hypothetical protein [Alistipes timonensis]MCM1406467.1 hypothetical protein [[Clostridium] fimetarium]
MTLSSITIVYEDAHVGPVDFEFALPEKKQLEVNEMLDLELPEVKPETINWASSDESVAEVIDGTLCAYKAGSTTISMTWDADTKFNARTEPLTMEVVVTAPLVELVAEFAPTSIVKAIDPANPETENVAFTALNDLADIVSLDNFSFASSNESVATFDPETGVVTLKGIGTATISASLTEAAALLYKFSEDSKTELTVTLSDINGPIGYELVTSLDQIVEEDYYTIAATNAGVTYAMSAVAASYSKQIDCVEAIVSDGMISASDDILKLKLVAGDAAGKYSLTTVNLKDNGVVHGTSSSTDLKVGNYTTAGTFSFSGNYVKINLAGTRQILMSTSSKMFKNYASSNATADGYAQVSLYKLNYVAAEAPIYGDFEGKVEGDVVDFTARHSSHKLQYREWFVRNAASRAADNMEFGEWTDAEGPTYTHNIIALPEGVTEHGIQVRAVDSRGKVSDAVGFHYNGKSTVTAIDSIAAEAAGEVELYNLQGVRVDRRSAAPGLYIERRGGKVAKVVL